LSADPVVQIVDGDEQDVRTFRSLGRYALRHDGNDNRDGVQQVFSGHGISPVRRDVGSLELLEADVLPEDSTLCPLMDL
jgi:hypothetical protein